MEFNFDTALTRADALQGLLERWKPAHDAPDALPLENAYGRTAAIDYRASYNLPVHRVSAFDGIAVSFDHFTSSMPALEHWKRGVDYVLADTGDDFPDEFDTVIAIEAVRFDADGTVHVDPNEQVKRSQNVRAAGTYMKQGELICTAGERITPEISALLAASGHTVVQAIRKLRVGYIPTGTELVAPGIVPGRGQNVEANSTMIRGFAQQWGVSFCAYPKINDDRAALKTTFEQALSENDVVIINGGSSRGSEDFNADLVKEHSEYFTHGVRCAPGRPVGIALCKGTVALNVPGPIIAAWLCCDWLLRGIIDFYYGAPSTQRVHIPVVLDSHIKAPKWGSFVARVVLNCIDGTWHAHAASKDSTLPTTLLAPHALVTVPQGSVFEPGSTVVAEVLRDLPR